MNSSYHTLIFDLGNVIIDIDYENPVREFQTLSPSNIREILGFTHQIQLFDQLERGEVSAQAFRDKLRDFLHPQTTDEQIDKAWKSILVRYDSTKMKMLDYLKQHYRTLALSNINEIHVNAIDEAAQSIFKRNRFADFFHAAYYSNEVGSRKPEEKIYRIVMENENLDPSKTLFIDDKPENVATALKLGWDAVVLSKPDRLFDILRHKLQHEVLPANA